MGRRKTRSEPVQNTQNAVETLASMEALAPAEIQPSVLIMQVPEPFIFIEGHLKVRFGLHTDAGGDRNRLEKQEAEVRIDDFSLDAWVRAHQGIMQQLKASSEQWKAKNSQ